MLECRDVPNHKECRCHKPTVVSTTVHCGSKTNVLEQGYGNGDDDSNEDSNDDGNDDGNDDRHG